MLNAAMIRSPMMNCRYVMLLCSFAALLLYHTYSQICMFSLSTHFDQHPLDQQQPLNLTLLCCWSSFAYVAFTQATFFASFPADRTIIHSHFKVSYRSTS